LDRNTIVYTIIVVGILLVGIVTGTILTSTSITGSGEVKFSDVSVTLDQKPYTITVTGSGKAEGKPDTAIITLGVQTEAATAREAVQENAEKLSKVVEALKELGISEEDLKTTHYSLYPIYGEGAYVVKGYRVINEVRVVVKDLDKASAILDTGVKAGANRVAGIQFTLSDDVAKELRDIAYKRALENAKAKAEKIAGELGLKITGIASVNEASYYIPPYPVAYIKEAEEVGTPIFEGEIEVTVTVQVVFTYTQG